MNDDVRHTSGDSGIGSINSIDKFTYVMQGLIKDRWSGRVDMVTDSGQKSVDIVDGCFVSATSELLEDRLGEIFYRYGMMSFDALTQTIMKLNTGRRIGRVALDDRLLSYNQLWFSLKAQIANVIRSVYLGDEVSYELKPNEGDLGYGLIEPSLELINRLKAFRISFRRFCQLVGEGATITSNPVSDNTSQFTKDLLAVVAKHDTVGEIILNYRLHPSYTMVCLMEMLADNHVSVEQQQETSLLDSHLAQAMNDYNSIAESVADALRKNGMAEAVDEILEYTNDNLIDCKIVRTLSLDRNAMLTPLTMQIVSDHCWVDQSQVQRYANMINSISKFASQLAIDLLPTNVSDNITAVHKFAASA